MADFVLGRLKFKWRGDWAVSTAYLIDDIVKYGGNTYVAVTNHTSAAATADFYTDLNSNSYWQLHTEGLFFKGDWAGSTFYKLNSDGKLVKVENKKMPVDEVNFPDDVLDSDFGNYNGSSIVNATTWSV